MKIPYFLTQILKLFKKSKPQKVTGDFSSPKQQNFSLPYNYMLYISDNNRISPKAFEKLQQTCKYFFSRQKVLIIDVFSFTVDTGRGPYYYYLKRKYGKPNKFFSLFYYIPQYIQLAISFKQAPKNVSFWLINEFRYNGRNGTIKMPFELPKLYHYSLKMLKIYDQNLDKNQFEILTTSAKLESLLLHHVTIMEKDRKMTWFEIYEKWPFLTDFSYNNAHEITSVETIMKLHTVDRKVKIKRFTLDLTVSSEFTDIIYLWKFMKDNTCTAWTKKRPWTRPYFRFFFTNANLHANFYLNGTPSFEYVIVLGVTDPNIIPKYDEKEFFENGVIKQSI